ncbi:D-alanyl-D-alanine endopeptidase [Marinobacter sp. HL-58]|uniref:D-alanyl-D-alanine endopeptidase n=1 Tax=Marinobacter sp. HL-58 TaxID=1479237 RepID=UPI00048430CF|nr:D-alanyl-D-alanine endopeptidase [Marinobacter sp. HL-58]KPQ02810.1 MAG: D-alanyl-D-alanine endopeptidase (penicillin-binding protein 7) PbpG [Marinobacter sp. HL-58]
MSRSAGFVVVALAALLSVSLASHVQAAESAGAGPDRAQLQLASVNAAVAFADADELVYGKNADRTVPIASITKLMTALVVMESGEPLTEWLEFKTRHIPAPANAYTRIREGSELKRADVLRIALMSSENFAAYTLARHHPGGYDAFVEAMNAKARELGMVNTSFVDPTGLSLENRSTAADLVRLVKAVSNHPQIREYSTTRYFTGHFRQPRYRLAFGNTNILVHRESWGVGVSKTGYLSDAGRCLVMLSEMDGRPVVTVLLDSLGSRSPMGDAGRIKRWLTTGAGGSVAAAARAYEQKKNAAYASSDNTSVSAN